MSSFSFNFSYESPQKIGFPRYLLYWVPTYLNYKPLIKEITMCILWKCNVGCNARTTPTRAIHLSNVGHYCPQLGWHLQKIEFQEIFSLILSSKAWLATPPNFLINKHVRVSIFQHFSAFIVFHVIIVCQPCSFIQESTHLLKT